jgi:hypothetical protein
MTVHCNYCYWISGLCPPSSILKRAHGFGNGTCFCPLKEENILDPFWLYKLILKGSNDGILQLILLDFWSLPIV